MPVAYNQRRSKNRHGTSRMSSSESDLPQRPFYVVTPYSTQILDLDTPDDLSRAQNVVLALEQCIERGYVFACEELDNFYFNAKGFPSRISGSTYKTDGNLHVFETAIRSMKEKVKLVE